MQGDSLPLLPATIVIVLHETMAGFHCLASRRLASQIPVGCCSLMHAGADETCRPAGWPELLERQLVQGSAWRGRALRTGRL